MRREGSAISVRNHETGGEQSPESVQLEIPEKETETALCVRAWRKDDEKNTEKKRRLWEQHKEKRRPMGPLLYIITEQHKEKRRPMGSLLYHHHGTLRSFIIYHYHCCICISPRRRRMDSASFVRNRYWVLRHGKSIPNEIGLIVSSMDNGLLPQYELSSEGVSQARLAAEIFLKQLKESNVDLDKVRICYSPFARTSHTARVVAALLHIPFDGPQCKMMEDLRERYFGPTYELKSHDKYPEIWALDEKDPFMRPEGGESADDVVSRLANAFQSMESEFDGCAVLVVSHGDPLQMLQNILQAAKQQRGNSLAERIQACRVAPVLSQHRRFALLTGELRPLL